MHGYVRGYLANRHRAVHSNNSLCHSSSYPNSTSAGIRAEGAMGRLQDFLTPLWRRVAGNCHLNRNVDHALSETDFLDIQLQSRNIPLPARRLLYGVARTTPRFSSQ
jgi:hypothetical protein